MRITRPLILGLLLITTTAILSACTSAMPEQPDISSPTNSPSDQPSTQSQLTVEQARAIAEQSECVSVGAISQSSMYNPHSKTWWFDLTASKPGCNPACVVDEATQTAVVNWRCTGALPPNQELKVEEQ